MQAVKGQAHLLLGKLGCSLVIVSSLDSQQVSLLGVVLLSLSQPLLQSMDVLPALLQTLRLSIHFPACCCCCFRSYLQAQVVIDSA